jgi:general secretion pathway protein J
MSGHDVRAASREEGERGFTLIEILAVLVVTGLVTGSATALTGQWLQNWDRGTRSLQMQEAVALALDRVAQDLEAALPMTEVGRDPPHYFRGSSRALVFVRPALSATQPDVLDVVGLASTARGLMRSRAPFRSEERDLSPPTQDTTPLLDPPLAMSFAYRDEAGQWLDEWHSVQLPEAVRLTVAMPGRPSVVAVVRPQVTLPSFCVQATSYGTCQALAQGAPVGLPDVEAASRRSRTTVRHRSEVAPCRSRTGTTVATQATSLSQCCGSSACSRRRSPRCRSSRHTR